MRALEAGSLEIRVVGDRALLVVCGDPAAVAARLVATPVPGQEEVVPAAETVLVLVAEGRQAQAAGALRRLPPRGAAAGGATRRATVDVTYDGPDLLEAAVALGLTEDALVAWHSSVTWRAAFIGFAPGFAYLLPDAPMGSVPRRGEPRTAVPPGSVALAGPYGAVYPRSSPGGWQLVGTTSTPVWDPDAADPALLSPGTEVRFRPVRARVTPAGPAVRGPRPRPTVPERAAGALEVLSPGTSTLVEDLGRPRLQSQGVPCGGAADRGAAVAANRLVGNARDDAVLEVVLGGLALRALGDHVLAVTGAQALPVVRDPAGLERRAVAPGRPFVLPDGWSVELTAPARGLRSYVGVRGGVVVPRELGSRATDVLSGLGPPPVRAGDLLPVGPSPGDAVEVLPRPAPDLVGEVEVVPGPRDDWLTDAARVALHRTWWTVGDRSNRVGLRLDGPPLERAVTRELPSEGAVRGAVQVPPSGLPIVLLVDHPVTGGYPVVGVVRSDHLDRLAQLRPGDRLRLGRGTLPGLHAGERAGGLGPEEVP